MEIRKYCKEKDEILLIQMIEKEGDDWKCYSSKDNVSKYKEALEKSITYVAYEQNILCGFSRSIDDCGFYIYVCDLLVAPLYRGKKIGSALMECIYKDYPNVVVYVMSDVDEYYKKLSYTKEGSIFEVLKR